MAAWRAIGGVAVCPLMFAFLAEAYGRGKQPEKGLQAIVEAMALVDTHGERREEAELYRLKGELTLQQQLKMQGSECKVPNTQHLTPSTPAEAEAEACFRKAIEISRKQQAKSLELRATVSFARL